jgi:hypothetical protein
VRSSDLQKQRTLDPSSSPSAKTPQSNYSPTGCAVKIPSVANLADKGVDFADGVERRLVLSWASFVRSSVLRDISTDFNLWVVRGLGARCIRRLGFPICCGQEGNRSPFRRCRIPVANSISISLPVGAKLAPLGSAAIEDRVSL